MKLIQEFQLLEAESKKYIDKDGKSVRRIVKDKPSKAKEEPTTTKATKRGPVEKQTTRERSAFAMPSIKELYGSANYDKRIKRIKDDEKIDSDFIGGLLRFAHERNGKLYYFDTDGKRNPTPMADVVEVGKTKLRHPMTGLWHDAQTIELRFANGSIIPATRLSANKMIMQNYHFKAFMPSGTAKFWSLLRDFNHR